MSRQADLRRVIWSAMVSVVKPGSRLANSTILMMHLVDSSLNLSHRPKSSCTLWSALEFWERRGRSDALVTLVTPQQRESGSSELTVVYFPS